MRNIIFGLFIKIFKVNTEEVLDKNLTNYRSINEFFTRKIDLKYRIMEEPVNSDIHTSPCDGYILSISEVEFLDKLIIIKGVNYDLKTFLFGQIDSDHYIKWKPGCDKILYQVTIYLSPGDCHRYYSPNGINITDRIYIPGYLESVKPSYINKYKNVLTTNERVTIKCDLPNEKDNEFFMTFVGAINVGSIYLDFDNKMKVDRHSKCFSQTNKYDNSIHKLRGEELGWFNFGSTIVLIFTKDRESNISFLVKEGDKIQIQQPIFKIDNI